MEDDDTTPEVTPAPTSDLNQGRFMRQMSSSAMNLALKDNQSPVSMEPREPLEVYPGKYRYLKGSELNGTTYDFAIVTRRYTSKKNDSTMTNNTEVAVDISAGVESKLIEKLVASGLNVDVLEGDFSRVEVDGQKASKYFVLLIRGNDEALATYGRRLKFQTWLRSGNSREVDAVIQESPIVTPAERIQVIDHIIRESAKIRPDHPNVQSIFPVHDPTTNRYLLKTFIGTQKLEFLSENYLNKVRAHFGEKVGYYFAFMDFYNKALVPIALLGVLLTCLRSIMGTPMYMRVLVGWALLISVIWSYGFLKAWSRRNNELNYKWVKNLETKTIVYRNPNFHGDEFINPITGLPDQFYPSWKRYPKYLAVACFMIVQISIMMFIIAIWITAFEVLKVRYPESGIFSVQWFYILGGGVLYGLFVDIIQWSVIVTKAARMFTEWENWKTIEQFEKSMIRKLFFMDFLNYYTWFFLLAFIYVIPGAGDTITNFLNTLIWNDPSNCCFGPYMNQSGSYCDSCPLAWNEMGIHEARCIPCRGWVTFDINHLDLETLFLTPIIITQLLNLVIAVAVPWIHRKHYEQRLRGTDRKVMAMVKAQGERRLLAEMTYQNDGTKNVSDHDESGVDSMKARNNENIACLMNRSSARYLENSESEVELLNAKARAILFEGEQETYDPYDDYHHMIVQFGFVVMFSMLWPLMPAACMIVNALKTRGDGFRLCRTNRRPFPRKASGIGEWHNMLHFVALTGVIVNIGLIFISTGAMEFFSPSCSKQIAYALGGDFSHYRFGPDFACFSLTTRMFMILVSEHLLLLIIWSFWKIIQSVPANVQLDMLRQEFAFKSKLYHHAMEQANTTPASCSVKVKQPAYGHNSTNTMYSATIVSEPTTPIAISQRSEDHAGSKEEKQPLLSTQRLAQAWDSTKLSPKPHLNQDDP
ncbi:Protein required for meiotic chromosome segregation [Plasmopara halstedii]|uniref:Protein required for meiotic chromosome segregation n=1 Tax=Plasmopara halstedii TaxID=4781 RepID=A0A0P1AYV0_PLAHL|nr:Protein required for meiotic chromosome segregation [Plasmopara halstedii]CEG46477.1 Protein required for meiotic chromosome segregation [Plasmopara halstedii]|eukprot:XP_024582846.1 Protein required for meiotic chromosome segregation [Plasmopara halstedii]